MTYPKADFKLFISRSEYSEYRLSQVQVQRSPLVYVNHTGIATETITAMSVQRVQVTYAAPLIFLQSDHWTQIRSALQTQLPLRNLHWKSATRSSIRTIQELDINLVALDAVRDEVTSQIPLTLLERPFLNIYVVACEVCWLATLPHSNAP